MAAILGPNIVSNNITSWHDFSTTKSFKGQPITNQFLVPTPNADNSVLFSVQGTGTFYRVLEGTYGGYAIKPTDVVYRYDLGVLGCHYHGNSMSITSGQYSTWEFEYYLSTDITAIEIDYLGNWEGGAVGISGTTTVGTLQTGKWISVRSTAGPATGTGSFNAYLYPGNCGSGRLAANGYILYKNPRIFHTNSNLGYTVPFVNGTRSTAQAVLDITGTNSITANSLTYNSSNAIFSGSPDYMTVTPLSTFTQASTLTFEAWANHTSSTQDVAFIGGAGNTGNFGWWLGLTGTNNLCFSVGNGTVNARAQVTKPATGTIFHLVGTYDGSNARIYLNGVLQATAACTGPLNYTGITNMYIGQVEGLTSTRHWTGNIYSTRFYNTTLSDAQVLQNFNAQKANFGL